MSWKSKAWPIVLVLLTAAWWVTDLKRFYSTGLSFDDAYMFWRYALHLREGLGWSWNLDGIPTYGQTSLLWGVVVWALTFLPLSMGHALMVGSWLTSGAALVAMARAVSWNARSLYLSRTWHVLPLVALPIVVSRVFLFNASSGMDTMLGLLMNALLVGMVLAWSQGKVRGEWVGFVGGLCFVTRPESVLAAVAMPVLVWWLERNVSKKDLARLLCVIGVMVVADLVFAKLYFHTLLPLGFYMKSMHAYEGYAARQHPVSSAMSFFSACGIFLIAMVVFARRKDLRLLVICTAPALLIFVYLFTVTQIMGFAARYYVPYFAFFAVPAILLLDRRLADRDAGELLADPPGVPLMRYAAAGIVLYFVQMMYPLQWMTRVDKVFEGRKFIYDNAVCSILASRPLPEGDSLQALNDVAEMLVRPLPKGATVAATEVGYLGGVAPQVNVIDLAGLNDSQIALNGFNSAAFLARKPDLIWMPHVQYTYERGLLFTDPSLLRDYVFIDGAAFYGIAIRKDSPYRAQIEAEMQAYWDKQYPGYAMSDYVVRSVSWDRQKHEVD